MNDQPLVSVILPMYNAESYILEAVNSILNQTYTNLELILIDDCSTDKSLQLVNSIQDRRLKVHVNETNQGVSASLNRAINLSTGYYIARMDADDYALPERIMEQVLFMNNNPKCAMSGAFAKVYGTDKLLYHPTQNRYLKPLLLFFNVFIHPTVIFKSDVIRHYKYSEDYNYCEDYELWLRISQKHEIANLPKVLLHYRVYAESVSFVKAKKMQELRFKALSRALNSLGLNPSQEELELNELFGNVYEKRDISGNQIQKLSAWLKKILIANNINKVYNQKELKTIILFRWLLLCFFLKKYKHVDIGFIKGLLSVSVIWNTICLLVEKIKSSYT